MNDYNSGSSFSYAPQAAPSPVAGPSNSENGLMSAQDRLRILMAIAASKPNPQQSSAAPQPPRQAPATAAPAEAPAAAAPQGNSQMAPGPLQKGSYPAGSSFGPKLSPEQGKAFMDWVKTYGPIPASHRAGDQIPGEYALNQISPETAYAIKNSGMESDADFLKWKIANHYTGGF